MPFFDLGRLLPARPRSAYERAAHALDRGRLDEAATLLDAALGVAVTARDVALIHNKRAVLAVAHGDIEGAIGALIDALTVDPHAAAPITTLANLTLEHGDLAEAIAHYEAAIRLDDLYAPAYHNLGVALHRTGRRLEAVRMLRKASRLARRMRREHG